MSKYGIKISRPGYDVRNASDVNLVYSSEFFTPKIVRSDMFQAGNTAHGLGYTPCFMHPLILADGLFDVVSVDDTNVSVFWDEIQVVLFSDPFSGSSSTKASGNGVVVNKGTDMAIDDLSVFSKFDTFKVCKTGTLTIEASAETLGFPDYDPESVTYSNTISYDLGYVPIYFPWVTMMGVENIAGSFNVNDELGEQQNWSGSGGNVGELLIIYPTTTGITMWLDRWNYLEGEPTEFPARTITMYVTILYNKQGESFNALA